MMNLFQNTTHTVQHTLARDPKSRSPHSRSPRLPLPAPRRRHAGCTTPLLRASLSLQQGQVTSNVSGSPLLQYSGPLPFVHYCLAGLASSTTQPRCTTSLKSCTCAPLDACVQHLRTLRPGAARWRKACSRAAMCRLSTYAPTIDVANLTGHARATREMLGPDPIELYLSWLHKDAELAQQVAEAWNEVVKRGEADVVKCTCEQCKALCGEKSW